MLLQERYCIQLVHNILFGLFDVSLDLVSCEIWTLLWRCFIRWNEWFLACSSFQAYQSRHMCHIIFVNLMHWKLPLCRLLHTLYYNLRNTVPKDSHETKSTSKYSILCWMGNQCAAHDWMTWQHTYTCLTFFLFINTVLPRI